MTDKKELRREVRRKIAELDDDYIRESDEGIFEALSSMTEFINAGRVFAYNSVGREVNTGAVIKLALELGKTVALPVVYPEGVMEFAVIDGGELVPGALGIPEPGQSAERITPETGDIILVPGLCYDYGLHRLGQGGGYYDRFLANCPAFSLGLAREKLLMEQLPREAHDLPVDCLVTEREIRYKSRD